MCRHQILHITPYYGVCHVTECFGIFRCVLKAVRYCIRFRWSTYSVGCTVMIKSYFTLTPGKFRTNHDLDSTVRVF